MIAKLLLPARRWALVAVVAFGLGACDSDPMRWIRPGVTTQQQVLDRLGTPGAVWPQPDGGVVLEYAGTPEGVATYMIGVGPDRIVRSVRQVLSEEGFAAIRPGMTRDEVRRALGKPRYTQFFPLKREEVWDWRYLQDGYTPMEFHVHFDTQGRVVSTSRTRIHPPE